MSAGEKETEPTINESIINKSEADVEPNDTISKVHKLQQRFFTVCGELFKYMEFIGEPMYNLMLEHYFAQYKREYELMNSAEFIEVDKQIEQLKIERDKELEAVKLEREKNKKLLDMQRDKEIKEIDLERAKLYEELATIRERELEAVRLEHKALTADIQRKKEKLDNEIQILAETAILEARLKAGRIIPDRWRHFHFLGLEFGKVYKNEAMIYAEQAAINETNDYLAKREQEVMPYADDGNEDEPEMNSETTPEQEVHQMTKREYKRWQKQFEKELRQQRKAAQAQIEKIMQEEADTEPEIAADSLTDGQKDEAAEGAETPE